MRSVRRGCRILSRRIATVSCAWRWRWTASPTRSTGSATSSAARECTSATSARRCAWPAWVLPTAFAWEARRTRRCGGTRRARCRARALACATMAAPASIRSRSPPPSGRPLAGARCCCLCSRCSAAATRACSRATCGGGRTPRRAARAPSLRPPQGLAPRSVRCARVRRCCPRRHSRCRASPRRRVCCTDMSSQPHLPHLLVKCLPGALDSLGPLCALPTPRLGAGALAEA